MESRINLVLTANEMMASFAVLTSPPRSAIRSSRQRASALSVVVRLSRARLVGAESLDGSGYCVNPMLETVASGGDPRGQGAGV